MAAAKSPHECIAKFNAGAVGHAHVGDQHVEWLASVVENAISLYVTGSGGYEQVAAAEIRGYSAEYLGIVVNQKQMGGSGCRHWLIPFLRRGTRPVSRDRSIVSNGDNRPEKAGYRHGTWVDASCGLLNPAVPREAGKARLDEIKRALGKPEWRQKVHRREWKRSMVRAASSRVMSSATGARTCVAEISQPQQTAVSKVSSVGCHLAWLSSASGKSISEAGPSPVPFASVQKTPAAMGEREMPRIGAIIFIRRPADGLIEGSGTKIGEPGKVLEQSRAGHSGDGCQ